MTRLALTPLLRWTAPPLAGLAALGLAAATGPRPFLINESPSLPRGVYLRTGAAVSRGAVVAVAPPPPARRYLDRLGVPPDLPLLKRAAAVPGDAVCADGGRVIVPFRMVSAPPRDRRGGTLRAWRGCRVLAAGELFVLGDTPASYDSRYFGPVRRDAVQGVYRRLGPPGERG